jgi:peroxiredoxin
MMHTLAVSIFFSCASSAPRTPAVDLASYRGDVLVLVIGSPTCPGTKALTKKFSDYDRGKPTGVTVMRIDVPPPGGEIKKPAQWTEAWPYHVDNSRVIAEELAFFYYPTMYILDKEGEVRYSGDWEDAVPEYVNEILAEKPGAKKRMFSPTMLDVGEKAAYFSGTTLDQRKVSTADFSRAKATLLIFSSTTCPFSKKAVASAPKLLEEFGPKNGSVIIVDAGGNPSSIRSYYDEKTPGVPVLSDEEQTISKDKYGVQTYPFFYVFDGKGAVAHRMPYTEEAARTAMQATLGLIKGDVKIEAKGAG